MPHATFLQNYRTFTSGNEAHPTYHAFCGLFSLSSIVSRRVWLNMDYFTIFPNLYIVLVGDAGNRKTSAMHSAERLLLEIGNIPLSAECVSKEQLIIDMVDQERSLDGLGEDPSTANKKIYSPLIVCASELSEFLQISGAGMIGFLTDVFDKQTDYEHKTKNKGCRVIRGPFLNLIACTTPEWITNYLKADIISGGFSRRTIFVNESEKSGRIPFPKITDEMRQCWLDAVSYGRTLQTVKGPFTWHPATREYYSKWYTELEIPKDANIKGYFETKHIQALKIAMLVALSEAPELVLKVHHFETALDILRLVEANLARVFQSMGKNFLNASSTKLLDILRASPVADIKVNGAIAKANVIPLKKLRTIMWQDLDEENFNKVLEHLMQTDRIQRFSTTDSGGVAREYIGVKIPQ